MLDDVDILLERLPFFFNRFLFQSISGLRIVDKKYQKSKHYFDGIKLTWMECVTAKDCTRCITKSSFAPGQMWLVLVAVLFWAQYGQGCDHNQLMIVCLVAGLVDVGWSRSTVFNH